MTARGEVPSIDRLLSLKAIANAKTFVVNAIAEIGVTGWMRDHSLPDHALCLLFEALHALDVARENVELEHANSTSEAAQ